MSPTPLRPAPEPVEVDTVRVVLIGTALWVVALIATLVFADRLAAEGRGHWVWICVSGIGLGLIGLVVCARRARRGDAAADESARPAPGSPPVH